MKVRDAAVYSIERATFMYLLERGVLFSVLFLFSSMNDIQEVCTRNLPPKLIDELSCAYFVQILLRYAGRRPILAREIVFMVLIVSYVL